MARRGSDKGTMSANVGAWMIACIGDTSAGGVVGEAGDETAGVMAAGAFIGDVANSNGACAAAEGAAPVCPARATESVGIRLPPWNRGPSTPS